MRLRSALRRGGVKALAVGACLTALNAGCGSSSNHAATTSVPTTADTATAAAPAADRRTPGGSGRRRVAGAELRNRFLHTGQQPRRVSDLRDGRELQHGS